MKFGLGQPVLRQEDDKLLRGSGRYVTDITLDGQLTAVVVRADVAHGKLVSVDAEAARAMPGVVAVYTHAEIAGRLAPLINEFPFEGDIAPVEVPHLAAEKVLFVGQPVAFVVAESKGQALDAAEAVEIEIEDLPVVIDPRAALEEGAPQLHPSAPGNRAYAWEHGDSAETERLFASAAHTVRTEVLNQRIVVAAMEPRAIAVRYDPASERWEAWVGCQGAHGMRGRMARALEVDAQRIRVHVPDVGGGFGMKLMTHPEYALAALAAKDTGRPVVWVGDRSESFLSDAQGRDLSAVVEGAFTAEGDLLALRMEAVSGIGALYSSVGAAVHTVFSAPLLGGMYRSQAIHCAIRGAFVNTPPTDAYRGAGRPEVIHCTERLMDAAARQMGIDRAELRRRNLVTPPMLPHKTPGGFTFDSLDTQAVMDRALADAEYAGFAERAAAAEARGRIAGIGIAYYMERTGGGPVERTRIEVTPEGGARIWIGTQSTGQGHATVWAQLLHEETGIDFSRIELMEGDSDALPAGGGTGGSRSAKMASQVILKASEEIREKGRRLAAEKLEAADADIEFEAGTARYRIAGTDRSVGLVELSADAGGITGEGGVDGRESTFPNGCHVAEVEIDPETGRLDLVRYTICDDFGRLLNPELVAGQVHGGVVQGLGQAMLEGAAWDPETGQPLNASFMDYAMPRAGDVPSFELSFIEVPAKTNPLGVKGCGEAGCCGGIPAATLAVLDALSRAGAEAVETPHTPEKLWRALNAA